jgi:chromosome segregation protein
MMCLIADAIDPQPGFETAVEAVLGESLQYIVVESQEAGVRAIAYLQSSDAGRGGFIPIAAVENPDAEPSRASSGTDRLLDFVAVKDGYEKVAQTLLGDVKVAESLGQAIDTFNRNGRVQTIVTRGGDMVSRNGILVGGSRDKLNGILVKKSEIKDLTQQCKLLERRIDRARSEQNSLEQVVRELDTSLQERMSRKSRIAENSMEAEKELYRISEDLKNTRRHLEIIQLEQEQLLGEASDIDDEMSKYYQVIDDIVQSIETARRRVAEFTGRISSVSTEMEAVNQQIVELKLQQTGLNARLENSTNSLRRLKEFQADGLKRLEQTSREIEQKNSRLLAAQNQVDAHEKTLSDMYSELKNLEEVLAHNESDYQSIDAQLQQSDDRIAEIQTRREKTQEKLRLLELEQSQREIKRDTIVQQLEERYRNPLGEMLEMAAEQEKASPTLTPEEMEAELTRLRTRMARIVDVNLGAIKEYEQLKDRYEFLEAQRDDLVRAVEDLHKVIRKINTITQKRFLETFHQINAKLADVFPRLFDGGTAKLVMTEPDKPLESGVEFMIHPPGKKLTRLSLMSGGEKALSAIAFIFSIFLIKPASFCLLDEIDAPLDDANIFRFNDLLRIIGEKSQIIMITHNKRTMEFADILFGITMEHKGISKIVSVSLERIEKAA